MVARFSDMRQGSRAGLITVTTSCPRCELPNTLPDLDNEKFQRWLMGELIQSVWPDMSPSMRETLMSGYHAECFALDFPEEED